MVHDRHAVRSPRGFTLIELLVVITIILLVSAVALPTVYSAFSHRQVSEAGRILHGAITGARDKAIHDGRPSGIRLLPDPQFSGIDPTTGLFDPTAILAYNRVIPIDPAPEYAEGLVRPIAGGVATTLISGGQVGLVGQSFLSWPGAPYTAATFRGLVLLGIPADPITAAPHPPTSWFWNIRLGDRVQIAGIGPWYTVAGPMVSGPAQGNADLFANVGNPAPLDSLSVPKLTVPDPVHPGQFLVFPAEYLILVNGRDDNIDGFVDSGWDGIDNDGNGAVDEPAEWEVETWLGAASRGMTDVAYTIRRRPAPSSNAREVALPSKMVIDATGWNLARPERSRLPVNRLTGAVDILVNPDGTASFVGPYGVPSSYGMDSAMLHFWLSERADLAAVDTAATKAPFLPIEQPGGNHTKYVGPQLKGHYSMLTLFSRTGQIVATDQPAFDDPTRPMDGHTYDPSLPFRAARQGLR